MATLEIADGTRDRMRGLLGRDAVDGAILLRPARSVHTIGMRFPIDVAFLGGDMQIVRMVTMRPNRVSRPVWRARSVVEAEAGAFASWGLRLADQLEVRGDYGGGP